MATTRTRSRKKEKEKSEIREAAKEKENKRRRAEEGDEKGRGPDERGPREVAALPGTLINLDPIFGPFSPCSYYMLARSLALSRDARRNPLEWSLCEHERARTQTRLHASEHVCTRVLHYRVHRRFFIDLEIFPSISRAFVVRRVGSYADQHSHTRTRWNHWMLRRHIYKNVTLITNNKVIFFHIIRLFIFPSLISIRLLLGHCLQWSCFSSLNSAKKRLY